RLRSLLSVRDYPPQHERVVCLYAQGFSLAHYLVHVSNKQTYLQFVAHGMAHGWDSAVQTFYRHRSVEELEEAWLKHLRDVKGMTIMQLAQLKRQQQQGGQAMAQAVPASRTVVLTAPPAQPLAQAPVFRGVAPTEDQQGQRFGESPTAAAPPGYLPG